MYITLLLVFIVILFIIASIKILKEYERAVVFRLGRLVLPPKGPKGPGLVFIFPFIDRWEKVSLRLLSKNVSSQEIVTKDNVSVKVNAVVSFKVTDPNKAITEVDDYLLETMQLAKTTLSSILGMVELDDLLSDRERINVELQNVIDSQTAPWGVKVSTVEVMHVDISQEMEKAMAKQAEAERERRAKIINAEGEFQAAERMVAAAKLMEEHPIALQLRYLQTLQDVAAENNSTTLFPIPIDIVSPFLDFLKK